MDVKQYQPKFIHSGRSLGNNLWRIFLLFGWLVNAVGVPVALIRTHWFDAFESFAIACAFWLVFVYERTLDRWEPWVPQWVKGNRP